MELDYLPAVVYAEYQHDFVVQVEFDNGIQKTIDFEQWLSGEMFESLQDRDFFQRFFIDGGTIAWPNGADIAPETLYEADHLLEESHQLMETAAR